MKFQVNKDVFSEAVTFAVKLLPQRTTLPILTGVLIKAENNSISISSFDYEVSARTQVKADISSDGVVLVSGRLLAEIASRLPDNVVSFELSGNLVTIISGAAKFSLAIMPVDEYPNLPVVEGVSGTIGADQFSLAVSQVASAASRDDVTPVITGVLFDVSGDQLFMTATDRYRVASRQLSWSSDDVGDAGLKALVPSKTLSEIGKTFTSNGDILLTISTGGERELVAFSAGDKTVTSLLIKGSFPPVNKLFPDETPNYAVVNTQELIDATRRVALVLEREAPLRYSFLESGLSMEGLGNDQSQATEVVEYKLTGEECVVSLKPQFLIDGLTATHAEFARIAFTKTDNPNKPGPVLISPQDPKSGKNQSDYKYLLQPNLLMR